MGTAVAGKRCAFVCWEQCIRLLGTVLVRLLGTGYPLTGNGIRAFAGNGVFFAGNGLFVCWERCLLVCWERGVRLQETVFVAGNGVRLRQTVLVCWKRCSFAGNGVFFAGNGICLLGMGCSFAGDGMLHVLRSFVR